MIKLHAHYVDAIDNATCAADLWPFVQKAIELEHATIPCYLAGYFSLMLDSNKAVGDIVRSVAIDEMLHMSIACNLMIALGGKPEINKPDFIPIYPGPLPMGIDDGLKVTLRKLTMEQVVNVYMKIEEPEAPIPEDREPLLLGADAPSYRTIGLFYTALKHKIQELGDKLFPHPTYEQQMLANNWFPKEELFAINDANTAAKAIDIIIEQGEGTPDNQTHTGTSGRIGHRQPDGSVEFAHYYRFEEIKVGRALERVNGEQSDESAFTGEPVKINIDKVWSMDDDPRLSHYKPGSRSLRVASQFAYAYTRLLNALHETFNGSPDKINDAMGGMYQLRLLAQQVLETPAEFDPCSPCYKAAPAGVSTGLCFEYLPVETWGRS